MFKTSDISLRNAGCFLEISQSFSFRLGQQIRPQYAFDAGSEAFSIKTS